MERLTVIQSVQTVANDVPLVAGKRTIVRAIVRSGSTERPTVGATLEALRGNESLGTLTPINAGGQIRVEGMSLNSRLEDTINFELPANWAQAGTIRLRVVLDPEQSFAEQNRANNTAEREANFLPAKTLKIRFVRYSYLYRGKRIEPTKRHIDEIVSSVRRMFPVPAVSASTIVVLDNCNPEPCNTTWADAQHPLNIPWREDIRALTLRMRQESDPGSPHALYFGIYAMPPYVADATARGTAWQIDRLAVLSVEADAPERRDALTATGRSGAHEIAHLLGRPHVQCRGDEEQPDSNFPTWGGKIGSPYTFALGLDVGAAELDPPLAMRILPSDTADLMTYCAPAWISPYTFAAIHKYIQTTKGVSVEGP